MRNIFIIVALLATSSFAVAQSSESFSDNLRKEVGDDVAIDIILELDAIGVLWLHDLNYSDSVVKMIEESSVKVIAENRELILKMLEIKDDDKPNIDSVYLTGSYAEIKKKYIRHHKVTMEALGIKWSSKWKEDDYIKAIITHLEQKGYR